MKKFLIIMMALMMSAAGINAQTVYGNNEITDNWHVGIIGGASTPLNFDNVFPINGFAGLKVGKDITPIFGFNIEGLAGFGSNGITTRGTIVSTASAGLNGTINWSNLVVGYNTNRLLNISTETGLSYSHTYYSGSNGADDLGAKTGVLADFKLLDAWHVYVEPAVYWNLTGANRGVQFNVNHAQLALQVGVVYRFKTSNGTHNFKSYDIGWYNYTINKLNEELAAKPKEVVVTETVVETVTNTVVDTVYVDHTYTIMFAQGSYELTPIAKATLENISGSVNIIGYASPEGTEKYNLELSDKRAKTVATYLEDNGVKVTNAEGMGVNGEASNRVVIVTIE